MDTLSPGFEVVQVAPPHPHAVLTPIDQHIQRMALWTRVSDADEVKARMQKDHLAGLLTLDEGFPERVAALGSAALADPRA